MKIKTVMKCSLYFIFILLLVAYASGQTARGKARQAGVVLDDEGNPVISAKVTIEYLGEDIRKLEGKTNKKGEWSFLGLGTGRWRITGTADGYIPAAIDIYVRQLERNPKLTFRRIYSRCHRYLCTAAREESETYFDSDKNKIIRPAYH